MDERVKAIRDNERVGRGSCTTIDECFEDQELIRELNEDGIETPEAAVKWAIKYEGLRIEQATNFRWGEDSDPEIKRYKEWNNES